MIDLPVSAPAPALLRRFDLPGSRYASYPPEDRYVAAFGAQDCLRALRERGGGGMVGGAAPMAIRLQVPFSESACSCSACDPIVTRRHARAADYVAALELEIMLAAAALGTRQSVSRLHLGGGTPWFLSDEELARIDRALRLAFRFTADADLSIEVDPRHATPGRLAHLRGLGYGRLGLGLQGFDPQVQAAVHCMQPFGAVLALVESARSLGFAAVQADLMFGLPRQTPASLARTVRELAQLAPDRVALSAYEHAPLRHKAQRLIDAAALPSPAQRTAMLATGIDGLLDAGYLHLGMNDFARAGDPLAAAKRAGRLHRDLLGFGSRPEGDVLALGVAATGRIGGSHYQNAAGLGAYYDALRHDELPVARGLALTRDELARRAVIMAVVCQGRVDFEAVGVSHLIDLRRVFARELAALAPFVHDGLLEMDAEGFQLTPTGAWFAGSIARVFDRAARREDERGRD
jgi:oxygen-independent coproporphyrinogen-3 oxidase